LVNGATGAEQAKFNKKKKKKKQQRGESQETRIPLGKVRLR